MRVVALLLLSFVVSLSAIAGKVQLNLSGVRGHEIGEGDTFYINITVTDIDAEPSQPKSVPGCQVLYFAHRSSSSSFQSINGRTSQSFTNTYALTLRAVKQGKFSFGPVSVGGVKSNAVSYTIGAPGQSRAQQHSQQQGGSSSMAPDPSSVSPTFIGKGNEQIFLRASVSKTTAYEQEALLYTVKLYTTYNSIKFIGATDAPKFDGFVIEESDNISDQLTLETYNGKSYATAIIARYVIFPQMPGKLVVKGNKYTVSADAEEYYHDPFFSTMTVRRPVQLHVTPNDLTVNVKALPTPRPANFSGGVGHFSISSSMPTTKVVDHQAASVKYVVSGSGNLKYITLPDLNNIYPSELEVFSPTTQVNAKVSGGSVTGSVTFDYSFMPMEHGNFRVPDVELVYFNPNTGRYETAKARGFDISVSRGKESAKSQATLAFSSKLLPYDHRLDKDHTPYVFTFGFWLLYIVPLAALVILIFIYRKHLARQSDITALRMRRAAKMARRRFRKAEACMKADDKEGFYTEMLKAVWGYLSDKLKLPTSDLNRENVARILAEHDISQENIDHLIRLLDDCEFSKYSQADADLDMNKIYDRGIALLNALEEGFRAKRKTPALSADALDNEIDGLNP